MYPYLPEEPSGTTERAGGDKSFRLARRKVQEATASAFFAHFGLDFGHRRRRDAGVRDAVAVQALPDGVLGSIAFLRLDHRTLKKLIKILLEMKVKVFFVRVIMVAFTQVYLGKCARWKNKDYDFFVQRSFVINFYLKKFFVKRLVF